MNAEHQHASSCFKFCKSNLGKGTVRVAKLQKLYSLHIENVGHLISSHMLYICSTWLHLVSVMIARESINEQSEERAKSEALRVLCSSEHVWPVYLWHNLLTTISSQQFQSSNTLGISSSLPIIASYSLLLKQKHSLCPFLYYLTGK